MPRKRFSAAEIVNKLREAEVLIAQDHSVAQVCKQLGVADQTYYRWRKEYGSLSMDQAKQLKGLQRENVRLKSLLADAELDKAILREAANPNF
jgi:transposase-like protein